MSSERRERLDPTDQGLREVLEGLYFRNEDITFRAVGRSYPTLRHASTITRNNDRVTLVEEYQAKQRTFRLHMQRLRKIGRDKTAAELAEKDQQILARDRQIEVLQAYGVATLRVIGEMGGTKTLLKFFEEYKEIRNRVLELTSNDSPIMKKKPV